MSGESSMLCVCRWRAQDDDSMGWIFSAQSQNPFTRLHPHTHCRTILSPCQFWLHRAPLPRAMLWRCAPQRTGCQGEKWQHRANVPISVSERSTSKCKPIMWCATTSSTGFQRLRSVGPSSSEDEPQSLKLKPLAHMRKQCCCGEAHGSQIATGRCQSRLNFIRQIPVTPTAQAPIWDTTVQQVSQRCAHSLCELQVLLKLFNPALPDAG